MSIPAGLKVTRLVNSLSHISLSVGESQILEEELDRMNTPYLGYGYAKDPATCDDLHPIIILEKPIDESERQFYAGVNIESQWKSLLDGTHIEKAYLEIEFISTERRTMQFAFYVCPDFKDWLNVLIKDIGSLAIMDRFDTSILVEAIQVSGLPLDMPEIITRKGGWIF